MWKLLQWAPTFPLLLLFHLSGCTVVFLNNGGTVKSVQITPASATVPVGDKQQFRANVTFTDGEIIVINTNAIWSTSDSTIASIDSDGVAKGLKAGSVTVTGTFINVSGTAGLTVTGAGVAQPQISGTATKLTLAFPASRRQFIYAANPLDDSISIASAAVQAGQETALGSTSVAPASRPVWLAIDPSGKFLYVADHGSSEISAFVIDPASGLLTPAPGSPIRLDTAPWSIAVDSSGQFLLATDFDSPSISRFRLDPLTGALSPEH